jgi:hypothetical protein
MIAQSADKPVIAAKMTASWMNIQHERGSLRDGQASPNFELEE